jgi:protein-S-isoprenylcysteine O-methyltransferase Ste14
LPEINSQQMNLIGKPSIHPVLFYTGKISGYATWVLLLLSVLDFHWIAPWSRGLNSFISFVLMLLACVFIVMSMINLGRSIRLGLPDDQTSFKTNGLYRISRNPMYVGFNFMTLSAMVYTLHPAMIAAGLYSIIIYHMIILAEEKFLAARFGLPFAEYKKRVRRYL